MSSDRDMLSAQWSVLGSMILEPKLVGEVIARTSDRDFLDRRCRVIYQAIKRLFAAGEAIDSVSIRAVLGQDEDWTSLLMQIMEVTPTAADIWHYVEIMQEQARLAHLQEIGSNLLAAQSLDRAQKLVEQAQGEFSSRPGAARLNMEEMLSDFYQRLEKKPEYLTWGLSKLNENLYVELGDMVVLGGYASAGKTALAVAFAWELSKKYRVGFYSMETNNQKLADRLIAARGQITLAAIKRRTLTKENYDALAGSAKEIIGHQLELIQAAGMSVDDIRADALAHRYQVILVDYLQIVRVEKRKNRTEEVADISMGLHQLAQSNSIAVIALSQLSRAEKAGKDNVAPTMASLRESGQIEQDADAIMLLYLEKPEDPGSRRVLHIAKNKEGTRGYVYLTFDGAVQTFRQSVLEVSAPKRAAWSTRTQVHFEDLPQSTPTPFDREGIG